MSAQRGSSALPRLVLATLLAASLAACTTDAPPTPAQPTPSPGLSPGQSGGPSIDPPSPSAEPTAGSQPTLPAEPTPTGAGTPAPSAAAGWSELADFPAGEAVVAAVAWTGAGFVAVGAEPAAGEDTEGVRQGVVWQSVDGRSWQRHVDEAFRGASLDGIAELDGVLYVFGFHSTCPASDDECPTPDEAGNAAWSGRPAAGWERLPLPATMEGALLDGVAVAAGRLVVRGTSGDEVTATLWLSSDGARWSSTTELAGLAYVSEVLEGPGGSIVALGTTYDSATDTVETRAAHSADGARFAAGNVPAGLSAVLESVADGPAGLLAMGNTVPNERGESGVVAITSVDGASWTSAPADALAGSLISDVHATGSGYLVIGAGLLPAGELLGRAWRSGDGASWEALPAFDGAPFTEISGSALGEGGLVVFTLDQSGEQLVVRGWLLAAEISGPG